jgi:hypothetical protein
MSLKVEEIFQSLPAEEREAIIGYGVALRLSSLNKRLFLAESKVRAYEAHYGTTLAQLDQEGLPDDASIEFHEDYVMWHHWEAIARKVQAEVTALQVLAQQGLHPEEAQHVGE